MLYQVEELCFMVVYGFSFIARSHVKFLPNGGESSYIGNCSLPEFTRSNFNHAEIHNNNLDNFLKFLKLRLRHRDVTTPRCRKQRVLVSLFY